MHYQKRKMLLIFCMIFSLNSMVTIEVLKVFHIVKIGQATQNFWWAYQNLFWKPNLSFAIVVIKILHLIDIDLFASFLLPTQSVDTTKNLTWKKNDLFLFLVNNNNNITHWQGNCIIANLLLFDSFAFLFIDALLAVIKKKNIS